MSGKNAVPLPCKFFMDGNCNAGSKCKYIHDTNLKMPKAQSIDVVCKFFADGFCRDGKRCVFIHDDKKAEEFHAKKKEIKRQGRVAHQPLKPARPNTNTVVFTKKMDNTASKVDDSASDMKNGAKKADGVAWGGKNKLGVDEFSYYGAPGTFETVKEGASYSAMAKNDMDEFIEKDDHFLIGEPQVKKTLCQYFQLGSCRYGDSCFYRHDGVDPKDAALAAKEIEESKSLECGICFEVVLDKPGEKFGLLTGCNHAFCLSCVRNWRGMFEQDRQNLRQCPQCRVSTYFITPSNRMIFDTDRKATVVEAYKQKLANIQCKHFDTGRGTCPFGSSCFYAHVNADGTLAETQVRTATDIEGKYDVLPSITIADFIAK